LHPRVLGLLPAVRLRPPLSRACPTSKKVEEREREREKERDGEGRLSLMMRQMGKVYKQTHNNGKFGNGVDSLAESVC
jgi:hypothetical protein